MEMFPYQTNKYRLFPVHFTRESLKEDKSPSIVRADLVPALPDLLTMLGFLCDLGRHITSP